LAPKPTQLLTHFPSIRMGERNEREKARKLIGRQKDSLTGKAKATHASKAIQGIHSLLPIGRQVFSHLQEHRTPTFIIVTWQDKCHNSKCLPFLPLPPASIAEHDVIWYGKFLWSAEVSYPVYIPVQLCVDPLLTHWHGSVRSRKDLNSM